MAAPFNARYVWVRGDEGLGRNSVGCFRRTFTLDAGSASAPFHVFADSSYQLFVNGVFVGFGPVRFDPRHPVFDSYDIALWLRPGRNVVAIQVKHFGVPCYKAVVTRAGFIAWGEVVSGLGHVGFETGVEPWKASINRAFARYTPQISFALDPADHFNQASEEAGWREAGFDDTLWSSAEPLVRTTWGPLAPRNIPLLDMTPQPVERVVGVFPLKNGEKRVSFTLPLPHFLLGKRADFSPRIVFSSWVWSPEDQKVEVGSFWGETWLNGELLDPGIAPPEQCLRLNQVWHCRKGWNYFFGKVQLYRDVLDYYLGVPEASGLRFSARRDLASDEVFRFSPVLPVAEYNQYLRDKPLPYPEDETLCEIGGWDYAGAAANPCFETSWDVYGAEVESLAPSALEGHVFRKQLYPEGFSVLFDLGQTRCLVPSVDIEGARGITVDLTYGEYLLEDGVYLRHTHMYYGGDRLEGARQVLTWTASQPRGMRYLKLTVRGACGDVRIRKLSLYSAEYPAEEKGVFSCSDSLLNEIWQLCRRTQQSNMEDVYTDCPTRERGMYARDVVIQYHANLALFGDHRLMGRCLELYAQTAEPTTGKFRAVAPCSKNYTITDFSLNLLEGYESYWRHTGDLDLIRRCWPAIRRNLAWFHKLADEHRDTLLLDAEWHLKQEVPQPYGGFHGDNGALKGDQDNTGLHCSFSCDYLVACRQALALAKALGVPGDVRELSRRIAILECSIPAVFWNRETGCYADNHKKTTHSIHASLNAVRAGVVTPEQLPALRELAVRQLEKLFVNGVDPSEGAKASPAYAYYLLDAVYRLGLPDLAEGMIRTGWGWMLSRGMRTCSEFFSEESSLCHAWSAHPAWYLSCRMLGVEFPFAPDLDRVRIAVKCSSSIQWAEGAFPHPKGLIKVKWHLNDTGLRVFDHVLVPAGVQAVIMESRDGMA